MVAQEAVAVRGTRPLERVVFAPERQIVVEKAPIVVERAIAPTKPELLVAPGQEQAKPCCRPSAPGLSRKDEEILRLLEQLLEHQETATATPSPAAELAPAPAAEPAPAAGAQEAAAERLRAQNEVLRRMLEQLREQRATGAAD